MAMTIPDCSQDYDLILVPARGSEKRLPVIIPLPTITSEQISLQSMKEESFTLQTFYSFTLIEKREVVRMSHFL